MSDPFFKIFLSSPGDVKEERDIAQQVIEEVNRDPEFNCQFSLKLYRWDDKAVVIPMEVEDTPQKSVDRYLIKPSACDLVVVIFWSKMGTPVNMDGRDYHSGTHYEYMDARENKHDGKPRVWLYRRTETPIIEMDDEDVDEKLAQYKRLKQFFADFRDEDGKLKGGLNEYKSPADLRDMFKSQLEVYLRHVRNNPPVQPPKSSAQPDIPAFTGEPYRGLLSLGIDDGEIFFGRERETLDMLARLEQTRLMFIVGASGSGKSSLAAAGVAARLKARGGWHIARFTPGEDPFYNLAFSLYEHIDAFRVRPFERIDAADNLAQQLRAHPERLAQLLESVLPKGDQVLILADQFEELFALTVTNTNNKETVTLFANLLRRPSKKITVLATMRADFMEAAIEYFEAELRDGSYTLYRPSTVALYEMILRPAQLARIELDNGLAQRIAEDAGTQPGALALVAYLLEQLHNRSSHRLRFSDYDDLGGVEKAIGTRAEDVFSELKLPDKESLLYAVFRDLVVVNEGGVATRQIASYNSFNSDEKQLVDKLTEARLLVNDSGRVEVAHEAVFRSWERLKKWIEDEQEDLIVLRQMREADLILLSQMRAAAAEWKKKGTPEQLWTYELQKPVFDMIARHQPKLEEHERQFMIPEYQRLLDELRDPKTTPKRRRTIGERLAALGDPRRATGLEGDEKPSDENNFVAEMMAESSGLHQSP